MKQSTSQMWQGETTEECVKLEGLPFFAEVSIVRR